MYKTRKKDGNDEGHTKRVLSYNKMRLKLDCFLASWLLLSLF